MEQNVIIEAIRRNGVINIVVLIGIPVCSQLLRAQNQNGFIAIFVIFDYRKGSKCLAQANTICQDTAVKLFQFVNNRKNRISLKIIEHTPNLALLKTRGLIRKYIF